MADILDPSAAADPRLDAGELQHSFWEAVVYARTMLQQLQTVTR